MICFVFFTMKQNCNHFIIKINIIHGNIIQFTKELEQYNQLLCLDV